MTVLKNVWPQPQVGEPCCQQQGNGDLRDKADDPQQDGVAKVLGKIGGKQGDVVFQAHKAGADDLQAAAVILKKAVINGGDQGDQLKDREDDEKRCNEDVAPLRVADRPFLFCFFSHETALLTMVPGKKGRALCPPPRFSFACRSRALVMPARPHRSTRGTSP